MKEQGQSRNITLDILRILACFLIVLAHTSSEGVSGFATNSLSWVYAHVLNTVGHTGTILFLFISGALLLSEEYRFTPKKFYTRNFLRLLVAYCAWVGIYHLIGFVSRGQYSWPYVKDVIINIIKGEAGYHFWYVPMLLGIYLILPMLRAICKAEKGVVNYFVALFLVVQVLFTTIKAFEFPYKYLVISLMDRIPFTLINHYVGYFVMGYWLTGIVKRFTPACNRWRGGFLLVTGVAISLLGDMFLTRQSGYNSIFFNSLFSVSMCVAAVGIFMMLHGFSVKEKPGTADRLKGISQLTFGVYMLHPLVLGMVLQIPLAKRIPIGIAYPLLAVAVFVLCLLLSWILSWIPGVREWVLYQSHAPKHKQKEGKGN